MTAENNSNLNSALPEAIAELSDLGLIKIKDFSMLRGLSEFQRSAWTEFIQDIDSPTQADWDCWRKGFALRMTDAKEPIIPGETIGDFSDVWQKNIKINAVEGSLENPS